MSEMSPPIRDASEGWGSRYSRMIPGIAGIPRVAQVPSVRNRAESDLRGPSPVSDFPRPRPSSRGWVRFLIPRIHAADGMVLFQLTALDLLVLVTACVLPSVAFPALSLPRLMIPAYAVLMTLFAFTEGLYKNVGGPVAEELPILARSALFAMVLVQVGAWNDMQPLAAVIAVASSLGGLTLWRQVRRRGWKKHFSSAEPRKVLVVGAGHTARAIAQGLQMDPAHQTIVVGFLDDHLPLSPQVLGRIGDLDWLSRSQFIDEVILAVPNEPKLVREAAEVALRNRLDIRAVPDLPAGLWPDAGVERIGGIPVIALHCESLPSAALLLKRVLDIAGALFGLFLIGPAMAVLASLIWLDSEGPIFYCAERTGTKGKPFRCYKFRSMSIGADRLKDALRDRNQREGPNFKLVNDPRITRFGHFLRRYSLDELPQLWNVLRGEMSLVGPRPHPIDEVKRYELHRYRRLDMKPGMTGLWQVTARNSPSFDLNMHLDLTYIETWTLKLDFRILVSTIHVLFAPEGA